MVQTRTFEQAAKSTLFPLRPIGDLTIFETGVLCDAIKQALVQYDSLSLDLRQVTKLDASAVQLLIATHRTGKVRLTGLAKELRSHFAEIGARTDMFS